MYSTKIIDRSDRLAIENANTKETHEQALPNEGFMAPDLERRCNYTLQKH